MREVGGVLSGAIASLCQEAVRLLGEKDVKQEKARRRCHAYEVERYKLRQRDDKAGS